MGTRAIAAIVGPGTIGTDPMITPHRRSDTTEPRRPDHRTGALGPTAPEADGRTGARA